MVENASEGEAIATLRTMTPVVVGAPLRDPGRQRQDGLREVQRLDLALLVHAQHHRIKWRIQMQPDDIAHLVDKQRIAGQLERFLPVRLQAKARQMRVTAVCESAISRAIVRVLQCVALAGTDSSVLAMTASTCASAIVRGAPVRGASSKPSRRSVTNRARHFDTVCCATRNCIATALFPRPSALDSTMRARNAIA
jgi:hypothetical protein